MNVATGDYAHSRVEGRLQSDLPGLPLSLPEQHRTDDRQSGKRDGDRDEYPGWPHVEYNREHIRQWNLPQPENEEIDPCRSPCIAGAVEGAGQHHSVRV